MEKLDLYTFEKKFADKTIIRGEKVPAGLYRLVVHACIFNSKGEMLIQRRADNKKYWPSLWDISVGGCVSSGETSGEAITREIKEELGIDIDLTKKAPNFTFTFEEGFDDWYFVYSDIDIKSLILQKEEVSDAKFASLSEIHSLVDNNKFISYQKHFLDFIFEMVNQENIFTE